MSLQADIQKDFGKFRLDVKLTAENEVMGLLGASGCGKSMTLKCIAGIVTPDRGKIVVDGEVLFDSERKINLSPQKRHTGLLFQNYALFPNMNVFQNIRTGILREKMDKAAKEKAVFEIMEKLHLTELRKRKPAQLSGGQQQRVALARILVSKPKILMLDEPFSALDSYLRWEVESELSGLLEEYGRTVLLVSHDRDEIYRLCGRACAIADGSASSPAAVEEMFARPKSISAALLSGCKNISAAKKLSEHTLWADDWGLTLWSDRPVPDTLKGVGIQAEDIKLADGKNIGKNEFSCDVERRIDDIVSYIYILALKNSSVGKRFRMDVDKKYPPGLDSRQEVRIVLDDKKLMLFCEL